MEVLLIDDHQLVSWGLASCLEETGRFSVAGQANSLDEAKRFIEETIKMPSLVILDIMLGEENGLDFLPFLKSFCQTKKIRIPPVLACSVLEDPFNVQAALEMGAQGYISKTGSKAELLKAIDSVLQGDVFVPDNHVTKLADCSGMYAKFTKRELGILELVKQGKTNQQIAKNLDIHQRTVENYIAKIYFKTGLSKRQELLEL